MRAKQALIQLFGNNAYFCCNMFSQKLHETLADILSAQLRKPVIIEESGSVAGGSINEAVKLKTNAGSFFVKWNNAKPFPGMFEKEAKGLSLLRGAGAFVPSVVASQTLD